MPRKPNNTKAVTKAAEPKIDTQALAEQQNEAAERLAVVVQQYGDNVPFEPYRYVDIVRTHLSRSAEEMLAAGRALVVAKEHLPHGEWGDFLAQVGLEQSMARRMAQAAVKFSNRALTHDLVTAAGNKTKLFELLVLDDEEVEALSNGGTVAGLTLDDIATKPTSELRAALREHQAEAKAAEQLRSDQSKTIDQLKLEVEKSKRRIYIAPPDEARAQLLREFGEGIHGAEHAIRQALQVGIPALREDAAEHGNGRDHEAVIIAAVAQLQTALDNLRNEFGIAALEAGSATPGWAAEDEK